MEFGIIGKKRGLFLTIMTIILIGASGTACSAPLAPAPRGETPTPLEETLAAAATDARAPTPTPLQEEPVAQPDLSNYPPVQQATIDLAEQLEIEPDEITVVRVEEVTWPDGSMGCPEPGMAYTQALVSGQFIQLEARGQQYNYHAGGSREPFLCTSKDEVLPEDLSGGTGNMAV